MFAVQMAVKTSMPIPEYEEVPVDFVSWLNLQLKTSGLRARAVTEAMGTGDSYISNIRRGHGNVGLRGARRIAEALGQAKGLKGPQLDAFIQTALRYVEQDEVPHRRAERHA